MNNSQLITSQPTYNKTTLLTSTFNKCDKPSPSAVVNIFPIQPFSNLNQTLKKTESTMQESYNMQQEQVLTSKSELREFIRKCAQEKMKYQSAIQKLNNDISVKDQRIQNLQFKIKQLKQQQQYLITALEDLRDKHTNIPASQAKISKILKLKQDQIQYLNNKMKKLKQWLKQEKYQAIRCIECVKMKDRIIENLQKENQRLKNEMKSALKKKKTETSAKQLRNQEQNELVKVRKKSKQMEEHIYQLVQEINKLRNTNASLKAQLQNLKAKDQYPEIQSPINKLKNDKNPPHIEQQTGKNVVQQTKNIYFQKYEVLCSKTYQLEMQIEKLMAQIVELKQQNVTNGNKLVSGRKQKKQNSFNRINTNPGEQILKQQHFQFNG